MKSLFRSALFFSILALISGCGKDEKISKRSQRDFEKSGLGITATKEESFASQAGMITNWLKSSGYSKYNPRTGEVYHQSFNYDPKTGEALKDIDSGNR